jgi:hypothetical protein
MPVSVFTVNKELPSKFTNKLLARGRARRARCRSLPPNFPVQRALSRARPMSDSGGAARKASRSAEPALATNHKKQHIEATDLDNDELVRRAVKLRSCEASGVTLHTLREVLRLLPADIVSLAPAVHGSPNSCSHAELASLLCFGPGEPAQLLTELKIAWDAVKEPRPQHDQLQMRAVQWLWLWVRGCGVTNLGRLADLVRATRVADPIARDAPPNAPGKREKRPKEAWGQLEEIAEEAPGVLAGLEITEIEITEAEIEIEIEAPEIAETARSEAAVEPGPKGAAAASAKEKRGKAPKAMASELALTLTLTLTMEYP